MKKAKIEHSLEDFLELNLFSNTKERLLEFIQTLLRKNCKPFFIFTPNAEQITLTFENPNFKRYLQQADLLIPDGFSLILASFLLSILGKSNRIKQRVAGIDLAQDLIKICEANNQDVLILGGRDYQLLTGSSSQIQNFVNLWKLSKNLFWTPISNDINYSDQKDENNIIRILNKVKPAVILVALGAPTQEKWSLEHKQLLSESGVKIVMVVGGAFDIILGRLKRAPLAMRRCGLEWLFRLVQEPWRWKRQLRLLKFWYYLLFKS